MKREAEYIDKALEVLRAQWLDMPYLRLGQLIVNAAKVEKPCPEVFYIEDKDLLQSLVDFNPRSGS